MPEIAVESIETCLFALSASYTEDVIKAKHDYENLAEIYPEQQEPTKTVLDILEKAPQLLTLTRNEIKEVLLKIQDFHGKAYEWQPNLQHPLDDY